MKSKKNIYDDYNSRLLKYITEYAKTNGVPPSVDLMIENVEGKQVNLQCIIDYRD